MHALRASMGQATPPADDADEDDLVRHWQRESSRSVQKPTWRQGWCLPARLQLLSMPYHMHCEWLSMPMTAFC